jgi:hypothetical protein
MMIKQLAIICFFCSIISSTFYAMERAGDSTDLVIPVSPKSSKSNKTKIPVDQIENAVQLKKAVTLQRELTKKGQLPTETVDSATASNPPSPTQTRSKLKRSSSPAPRPLFHKSSDQEIQKTNPDEEFWKDLALMNEEVYETSKARNLSKDQVETYLEMAKAIGKQQAMGNQPINPAIFGKMAQPQQNNVKKNPSSWEQGLEFVFSRIEPKAEAYFEQEYEKIMKNPNEAHKLALLVDLLHTVEAGVEAGEEVVTHQPALAATHISILQNQNADQKMTIRQQWVGLLITLGLGIPAALTTFFQLFSGGHSNSTAT